MNFSIQQDGVSLTASDESTAHALGDGAQFSTDLMIDNPGPEPVYVRAGAASVSATAASMRILPGEKGAYSKGSATHIAIMSAGADQTVTIHVGSGS